MENTNQNILKFVKEGLNLNNNIEYQNETVVSKTLINKKAGTITLFAFDKDEGLSEHTAPFDAFVYIISGNAEIKIEGKNFNLSAGEFIILPANKPHALKAVKQFKMLLIMIREKSN